MRGKWIVRGLTTVVAAVAIAALISTGAAGAAPADIGSYPAWTKTAAGQFSGTFPAAAAFPNATVATNDTGASVASGKSAFLGATTGWGQTFGSSRLQPYITIASLGQTNASTSTVTFDSATPVGWGFAVGDIDADYVTISATGPGGPLDSTQLGARNTNNNPVLNYCLNASPKPSTCGPGNNFTDVPAWCPATAMGVPCDGKPANSVVGHSLDSSGAYDWFVPTVPVTSMTLTFTPLSGLPNFQLWIVAPTPATTVTGTIVLPNEPAPPAGTQVALLDSTGAAVPNIQGDPVSSPVAPDGSFRLDTANGDYELAAVVPTGFTAPAPVPFTANSVDVDLGTLAISAAPVVVPPVVAPAGDPELAPTGANAVPLLLTGSGVILLGLLLVGASRRRRTTRQ
ncbi:hypothetical protein [Glaciihabitans sp. UYNi722]|uniref:hypothetical protein n=1 Tax=Glaciihabitans sp. UYNi722 TaxID=3156344 RepID=UPI003396911E